MSRQEAIFVVAGVLTGLLVAAIVILSIVLIATGALQ